jgi:beta-galactosidase
VPITDNEVTFKVTGPAKLIGVGNGDPTDQQSDKGTTRKAFSGYCMGVVQATKSSGTVTVEVTSPGLVTATATISAKSVELRPQVAVWEREIPTGAGITGLWRPVPAASQGSELLAFVTGGGTMVFTLRQDGSNLTGTVEGAGGGFFGGTDAPIAIQEGKIDGTSVSFKAGNNAFSGSVKGDQIELERTISIPFRMPPPPAETAGSPAVGPPPDGSDPSINPERLRRRGGIQMVLQRAQR